MSDLEVVPLVEGKRKWSTESRRPIALAVFLVGMVVKIMVIGGFSSPTTTLLQKDPRMGGLDGLGVLSNSVRGRDQELYRVDGSKGPGSKRPPLTPTGRLPGVNVDAWSAMHSSDGVYSAMQHHAIHHASNPYGVLARTKGSSNSEGVLARTNQPSTVVQAAPPVVSAQEQSAPLVISAAEHQSVYGSLSGYMNDNENSAGSLSQKYASDNENVGGVLFDTRVKEDMSWKNSLPATSYSGSLANVQGSDIAGSLAGLHGDDMAGGVLQATKDVGTNAAKGVLWLLNHPDHVAHAAHEQHRAVTAHVSNNAVEKATYSARLHTVRHFEKEAKQLNQQQTKKLVDLDSGLHNNKLQIHKNKVFSVHNVHVKHAVDVRGAISQAVNAVLPKATAKIHQLSDAKNKEETKDASKDGDKDEDADEEKYDDIGWIKSQWGPANWIVFVIWAPLLTLFLFAIVWYTAGFIPAMVMLFILFCFDLGAYYYSWMQIWG